MTTVRGSQLPSLRLHLKERLLLEQAAKAAGQNVTEWARDVLLEKAAQGRELQPSKKKPPEKRLESSVRLKAVEPPTPPPRRGLELDEETSILLSGGRPSQSFSP